MAVTAKRMSGWRLDQLKNSVHVAPILDSRKGLESPGLGPTQSLGGDDSCGACPYCEDTCGNPQCSNCSAKLDNFKRSPQLSKTESESPGFDLIGIFGDRCSGSSASDAGSEKFFTMCQLRRHCTEDSAWLLVGDTIYDATSYVSCHPGGKRSILKKAGGTCDCTEDLNFHSRNAKRMWKKNKVGRLRKCEAHKKDFGSDEQCTIS